MVVRSVLWVFLGLFLTGCSSYRLTTWPDSTQANIEFESRVEVAPGQDVRVTLNSGEVLTGQVAEVSDTALAIVTLTEQGESQRIVLQAEEIAVLELEQGPSSGTVVLGVVVVAGMGYALVKGIQGWSMY